MDSASKPTIVIARSVASDQLHIQWHNSLPNNIRFAWIVLVAILIAIWLPFLSAFFDNGGAAPAGMARPKNFVLFLFGIPLSLASITMLMLAIRATFGNRSESIQIEGDAIVYARASAAFYLFAGEISEDDDYLKYAGSLAGGIAAALSGKNNVTIHRDEISKIESTDRECNLRIGDHVLRLGSNLSPQDIKTIADALRCWHSGS